MTPQLEQTPGRASMPDIFSTVSVSQSPQPWRRALGFLGPGFLISVGYMDPGKSGPPIFQAALALRGLYAALRHHAVRNLLAILPQASGAQARHCHRQRPRPGLSVKAHSKPVSVALWLIAEIRHSGARDLAEVIGLGHRPAIALSYSSDQWAQVLITVLSLTSS